MRLYQFLNESTSDDLFRKLDSIERLINDPAATPGEKEAASKAKEKIILRLNTEFPNAKPTPKPSGAGSQSGGFWDDLMRGYKAYRDQQDRYAANPDSERRDNLRLINTIKTQLAHLQKYRGMGNVEVEYQYKTLWNKLERLMEKWQPEEYAALKKKREEKAYQAGLAADKKKAAKQKEINKKSEESGLVDGRELKKEYKEAFRELSKKLQGQTIKVPGYTFSWKASDADRLLSNLHFFGTPVLRDAIMSVSDQTRNQILDAVKRCQEVRANNGQTILTPAQKAKIYKAFPK